MCVCERERERERENYFVGESEWVDSNAGQNAAGRRDVNSACVGVGVSAFLYVKVPLIASSSFCPQTYRHLHLHTDTNTHTLLLKAPRRHRHRTRRLLGHHLIATLGRNTIDPLLCVLIVCVCVRENVRVFVCTSIFLRGDNHTHTHTQRDAFPKGRQPQHVCLICVYVHTSLRA